MNDDNIENIRKNAVTKIKEKVKQNPKYLHPMNKERQEDMKRLKFSNGNDFNRWMQHSEIMKNPTDVQRIEIEKTIKKAGCRTEKEYKDKCAQTLGFKDWAEREKDYRHKTGRNFPAEDNPDCSTYFGEFTENLMIRTFENPVKMPYGNRGFDWICKKGEKIDNKGACLTYYSGKFSRWEFPIRYNNISDWFILSAWDNRHSLNPLYVWAFHKNDIIRGRKFWKRTTFSITNTQEGLKQFEKYEVNNRLDKLKELLKIA